MEKSKNRIDPDLLLLEVLHECLYIRAHLDTLFMMQCELFAHINKSESPPIADQWGEVRTDFLKQNLDALDERLRELANQ